ncbi:DUF3955 domain-containing protein [Bacillaceae bacterium SIJ1]|uniref:DUF3955 domain-containing protein n=1 Tax=Litoribacterium kuwaitense TaxID=1398745 RepID=UPI0013EAD8B3|nr:DUF3955 domain-containing protein [Litoribacterium kuwaitense]NGP45691.1 DUF3955 domain-containing protein [Litoribacterium kuwaitense]
MKRKYLYASIPVIMGAICMVSYNIIGSRVEPDGTLVEPFFLIPLGYLFSFVGIATLIIFALTSFLKNGNHQ